MKQSGAASDEQHQLIWMTDMDDTYHENKNQSDLAIGGIASLLFAWWQQ